jgi:hypothetical protein
MKSFVFSSLFVAALSINVSAVVTRIDSVTVDSVWANDSTDTYGFQYPRRDVMLSFKPVATESVTCVVDMSVDSGKTWNFNRDFFSTIGDSLLSVRAAPNVKRKVHIQVQNGDTTNVVFRVTGQTDTTKVTGFRIKGSFDNWTEVSGSYYYLWSDLSMALLMDGYYFGYTSHGMVNGFENKLSKQDAAHDTLSTVALVIDCGTKARADSVYYYQKPLQNAVALAFPDSVAVGRTSLKGLTVLAHFRHFYCEFAFAGYPARDSAIADANRLINYCKTKSGL